MKKAIIFLLSFSAVFCTSCSNTSHKEQQTGKTMQLATTGDAPRQVSSDMPVTDIQPGQFISSPLTIDINSMGKWTAYEGELGVVKLYNDRNELLTTAIMRSKDGNWMTGDPSFYIAELAFDPGESLTGRLVFRNRVISPEEGDLEQSFEIPVNFLKEPEQTFCYAWKTRAINNSGENYNYEFVRLAIDNNDRVTGTFLSAPYGIDGSKGSISGTWDSENLLVTGRIQRLAEGELSADSIRYEIKEKGLYPGFNNEKGEPYIIPEVDCETFDNLMKAHQVALLENRTNTTDRARLLKNKKLIELGYTKNELGEVRFLEVETDLDGSYSNREYLLFVIDRMICGTGGCTLYVVDEDGKTLSATSVVKLPVFTSTPRVNGEEFSGTGWKDLYVWSDGAYRKLIYSNGNYFYNASLAPAMAEENLTNYPEKYHVIMDYLD